MARVVEVKVGRRTIRLYNRQTQLVQFSEEVLKAFDARFVVQIKKALSKTKKEIKIKEKRKLEYLGITDEKIFKKNVKIAFNKFLDSIDITLKENSQ